MGALIEADGLVKRFGKTTALDALDVTIPVGQTTALLGPNGAGKTTLIRTVATLLQPDAGQVRVLGHDVVGEGRVVRRLIGLAGQSAAVEPALSGRENLVMVARLYGENRRKAMQAAAAMLETLDLGDACDRPVRTYSGGMRRRLDLGASLVGRPSVLLLDEPTTGLDPASRAQLWDTIRALGQTGTDILLTTQYLDEADQLAARIVIVDAGRVIAEGTPGELKSRAGIDRLEVRVHSLADLSAAASLVAPWGIGAPELDPSTRRCSVACPDSLRALPAVARAITETGLDVEDLAVRRPTLDEVFLTLTGRQHRVTGPSPAGTSRTATDELEGAPR
jgi:ABC-2 type transport system ATP-binding protein